MPIGRRIIRKYTPEEKSYENLSLVSKPKSFTERKKFYSPLKEEITSSNILEKGTLLKQLKKIDGLTFREVEKYVEKIVTDIIFDGDKEIVELLNEWKDKVHLLSCLENVVRHIFVKGAGNAFVELGYNEDGTDILALRNINPLSGIDFIRDESNQVKLDDNGDPIGYTMNGYYGIYANKKVEWTQNEIKVNDEVVWTPNMDKGLYPDGRDRIAHFKFYGDEYLGETPLESAYKLAKIRLNLEDGAGEAGYREGAILITVGKEDQHPSDIPNKLVDDTVKLFQKLSSEQLFGIKPGIKVQPFPTPDLKQRESLMYYFADLQGAAMGRAIILDLEAPRTGRVSGEFERKAIEFELSVITLQRRLAEQIRDKIFSKVLKARGIDPNKTPKIKFITRMPTIERERSISLARLARRGIVRTPNPELEIRVLKEMDYPTTFIETKLDEWLKEHSEKNKEDLEDQIEEVIAELREKE